MERFIAFLRAINVGGHTLRMQDLRRLFEGLGLRGVETFIASGNVVFEAPPEDAGYLERLIEGRLHEALGYEVHTFLRSAPELAALAAYRPFPPAALEAAAAHNVAFLAAPPAEPAAVQRLMALRSPIDDFHVHGREVYWLCQVKQSQSTFSNAVLEKALGLRSTLRGLNTVQKMAQKYCISPSPS
jgi:uncharacterized protein (DUF1697 family)